MKIAKSLKRPVVVILLVAVIGIIVFSVVRYLMGDKEQFVEGTAVVSTADAIYTDGNKSIVSVASTTTGTLPNLIDTTASGSPFSGTPSCGIENGSLATPAELKVGCKRSNGMSKIIDKFDLTKCQKNSSSGKYIVSNNAGTFTCPTVGPTTRGPTTRGPTTRGPTTRPPR
jgi:hypothetical protein